MGPQYQATVDSYAASPQAAQSAGNQTLGKSIEQSPVHVGFGTGSSMYDNDMDKGYQPAPVAMPPQPQNQPSSAGINPSWAQQSRKRGGRTKRFVGGMLPNATTSANAMTGNPMMANQSAPMQSYGPRTFGQQAAGLAAFNLPGQAQGAAQSPLSEFGSMYNQPNSMMMTGDTMARFNAMPSSIYALANDQNLPQNTLSQMSQAAGIDTSLAADQAQAGSYIDRIFRDYLGRDPDVGGKKYYMNLLQSGGMTPDQIQKDVLGSQEYQSQLANAVAPGQTGDNSKVKNYVDNMFRTYLGRAPDVGGQQYYLDLLSSGKMTPEQFKNDILGSKEYTAKAAAGVPNQQDILTGAPPPGFSGSVSSGSGYKPISDKIGTYVDQIFNQYLGRAPDEGGRKYYADQLLTGAMTPEQVQRDVLGSREFKTNLGANIPSPKIMRGQNIPGNMEENDISLPYFPDNPSTGITPNQPGTVDPFVAQYNARMNAAQNIYGGIAQQNYMAGQEQQKQYEADLASLQQNAQDKLAQAEITKKQQDEEAARRAAEEAAFQQQLLLLMLMSRR